MERKKIIAINDLLNIEVPTAHAIRSIEFLGRVGMSSRREYISPEEMAWVLLESPGRFQIEEMLARAEDPETEIINFLEPELALSALRDEFSPTVPLGRVIAYFQKRHTAAEMAAAAEAPMPVMPGPDSLSFLVGPGTPTPPGASRSDKLDDVAVTNLFSLTEAVKSAIAQHNPMGFKSSVAADERQRDRTMFLLKLRGHRFREAIPELGHNCLPLRSGEATFTDKLCELGAQFLKKDMGVFFRYPLLFQKLQGLLTSRFIQLAMKKSQGADEKIRILDLGAATGEEPISIALIAAFALRQNAGKLAKILGREPGKLSDWIEITAISKEDQYCQDIIEFIGNAKWPLVLRDEIPPQYLGWARRYGLIIEDENTFSFAPELAEAIRFSFLNYFNPAARANAVFSRRYDFVFNIKTFEYVMTDPKTEEEAETGQYFIDLFDSGALIAPQGYLLTDGAQLRTAWTTWIERAAVQGMLLSRMRRMPGGEQIFGPRKAKTDDLPDLLGSEIMFPLQIRELSRRSFEGVLTNYPMNEVAIYQFNGRIANPEAEWLKEQLEAFIHKGDKVLKLARRALARPLPAEVRRGAEDRKRRLEDKILQAQNILSRLRIGVEDARQLSAIAQEIFLGMENGGEENG